MKEAKRTPGPLVANKRWIDFANSGDTFAEVRFRGDHSEAEQHAAFIVRACNSFDKAQRERELYRITVKDDGTWLELSGPTKMASIRLENGHGPIVNAAIREVREALSRAEGDES